MISIAAANLVESASPLTTLSTTLNGGQGACPGEKITFTCVTNGSASHAWMSDQYIGQGGIQLEFASYHNPGAILRKQVSPEGTLARLIANDIEENSTVGILESQLDIIASADYPSADITCLYVDTRTPTTTRFQLLGMS